MSLLYCNRELTPVIRRSFSSPPQTRPGSTESTSCLARRVVGQLIENRLLVLHHTYNLGVHMQSAISNPSPMHRGLTNFPHRHACWQEVMQNLFQELQKDWLGEPGMDLSE